MTWVKRGGLSTFLFFVPLLLVFGAFSWYPIVRLVLMSFQHTNLVQPATWVGFANFSGVIHDPLFPIAVRNTAEFAGLALVARVSHPGTSGTASTKSQSTGQSSASDSAAASSSFFDDGGATFGSTQSSSSELESSGS